MQIALFSDTHSEFQRWHPPALPGVDVIVVAGDLGATPDHYMETLCDLREKNGPKTVIVTVLGNHEFYKGPPLNDRERYHAIAEEFDVQLLDNSHFEFEGVTFVGGTLWTDANASPLAARANTGDLLNDYNCISWHDPSRPGSVGINTYLISEEHFETKKYIFETLQYAVDRTKVVVVTHHAPSHRSVENDESGRGHYEKMSDFYCSNFDRRIDEYGPAAWLHGHIHASSDYMLSQTRVVCNPRGYGPRNFNPDFQPAGARIVV